MANLLIIEMYHILLLVSIQLLSISILRGDESFIKRKSRDIYNSMSLGRVTNEDEFPKKILDQRL